MLLLKASTIVRQNNFNPVIGIIVVNNTKIRKAKIELKNV